MNFKVIVILVFLLFSSSVISGGMFESHVGPSLQDLLDAKAMQNARMTLQLQQIQMNQQQIEMQRQQMNERQQDFEQHKVEIVRYSLSQLPENIRNKAIQEIKGLGNYQQNKLMNIVAAGNEEDRIKFFWFIANASEQEKQGLIEKLSKM